MFRGTPLIVGMPLLWCVVDERGMSGVGRNMGEHISQCIAGIDGTNACGRIELERTCSPVSMFSAWTNTTRSPTVSQSLRFPRRRRSRWHQSEERRIAACGKAWHVGICR